MSAGMPGRGPAEPARADIARSHAGAMALLDALQSGIAVVAADYTVAHANPALERLIGAPPGALSGRVLWDALPDFAANGAADIVRMTCRDGMPRACRVEPTAEGHGIALDCLVSRDSGGALVLEVREATTPSRDRPRAVNEPGSRDAVRHERELDERNRENESLRELARQLAAVSDSKTVLSSLAASAQAMCAADAAMVIEVRGSEGEVVAGSGVDAHLPGTRFALAGSLTERVLAERTTVAETEYLRDHPNFRGLAPQFEAGPALGAPLEAHGQVLGVLTVSRESGSAAFVLRETALLRTIADHAALALSKSRLLEEAQAANQAKSNFLTTMSHELRTPLTALTGYGELLADEILGPLAEAQLDIVERMRSVTHHLSVMIEEILTFSSLEAGRERVRRTRFEASEAVHAAIAVIEPLARHKGLEVGLDLSASAQVETDIDKVRQILVNLAGNAVKFTDSGRITIAVTTDDRSVRFAVSDTGIGITTDDLHRLFHPFAQLDTGLTRRHGGTGLGLYISQRLAILLDGEIEVRSEPGRGSTFTLRIPDERDSQE